MNTIDQFLSELRSLEINLWAEGDRLRYKAPKETLTPALLQELRERKLEIIEFLHKANTASTSHLTPILPVPKDGHLPLSFAQARLWFLAQLEADSSAYNLPTAFRLTGSLNVTALEQSLSEIVRRHSILRTTFLSVDGQPKQVISSDIALKLPVIDLRQVPSDQPEAEAQRLANEEAQQPFDRATSPLFRFKLLRLSGLEYVLLLTIHHIVYDGWSYDIFFRELTALYNAFSSGKPSPLMELSIQYADFAVWQRDWLSGEVLESQLNYWKKKLSGDLPVLELPTDYPRPPIQTHRGAQESLELPPDLSERLKTLCQQKRTTLFMVLLAAFQILLSRHSGQEDMIVGTPIAGRNRLEIEGLLGLFVNTLVLRTDLSGNPSFRELLERVREVALGAYAHQDLPFEKLVEELHPERDLSRTPLFQVWFNMVNLADEHLYLSGLTVEPFQILETPSKFDLTLYVREQDSGIRLDLVYNAELFAPERMVEMLVQFNHLLMQIVAHPEERIAQFSLVTPTAESLLPNPSQLLDGTEEEPISAYFSRQAQRVPEKLAVVDTQVAWTYKELDTRSNQLANYLLEHGIKGQDVIAIYGHRSALLVWAILGVLKAGAAFVILDPAYPASRLINCLHLAQPQGWLQLESASSPPTELEEFLTTASSGCFLQLSQASVLTGYSSNHPEVAVDPDNLAYVAFTSGSTGMPKGIKGTHRPLSHFLKWHCQTFDLNQSDRFSLLSGLSHDPLLRDIFTPLSLGATLCIPKQQDIEIPGQLAEWMRQQEVSIAHLTPAMGQLLTETLSATSKIPSLRYVFFGGDVLTKHDVAKVRQLAPGVTCVNFYGATETPQAMGYFVVQNPNDRVEEGEPASLKESIPLGRGVADVQLLVLNTSQQLAGVGEVGEIYVRTPYLAQGYISDETLTQERFIINPFTKITGDKLYVTGDLGRYLPDGNIEFLGRTDHLVKIRGFRIELGEIEANLGQHPMVQQCAIVVREDVVGDKRLVAYVVPNQVQALTTSELRRFLKQKLPDYMVPSAFVMLDALPLTPNGKVDRRALPVPDQSGQEPEETFVAPRDELELQLTKIWEKVLGKKPIGIRDNFFELGGHSLLAVRLFAQIEKTFGKDLPLATLFQAPTVEQIANIFRQKEWSAPWSSLVAIQPEGSKPPLFAVHSGGGNVLNYRNLARYLGSDQPFYALQAQGLDGKQAPHTLIKDIAAHYVKAICSLQPEGPYFLGGHCFGGIVAFEMAQQLHAQGQPVALLAFFDTGGPNFRSTFSRRFSLLLMNLLQLEFKEKLSYIWQRVDWNLKTNRKIPEPIRNTYLYLRGVHRSPVASYIQEVLDALNHARRNYVPQAYLGQVTLFLGKLSGLSASHDPHVGWGEVALGGVEVHEVPGHHINMLEEPHIQVLAEKLKACLDKAQVDTSKKAYEAS
jgi:amino acid adenylation domain-containing protein